MNFASVLRKLTEIKTALSFEAAFKRNDEHLENALWTLNLCIDHLIALQNDQYIAHQNKKEGE